VNGKCKRDTVVSVTSLKIFSYLVHLPAPTVSKVIDIMYLCLIAFPCRLPKLTVNSFAVISHNICNCENMCVLSKNSNTCCTLGSKARAGGGVFVYYILVRIVVLVSLGVRYCHTVLCFICHPECVALVRT